MCAAWPMNFIGYVSARFPVSLYVSVHAIMSITVFFKLYQAMNHRDLGHHIALIHYDMHCHVIMYDGNDYVYDILARHEVHACYLRISIFSPLHV